MPEKEPILTRREAMTLGGAGLFSGGLILAAKLFRDYATKKALENFDELVKAAAYGAGEATKAVDQIAGDIQGASGAMRELYEGKPRQAKPEQK